MLIDRQILNQIITFFAPERIVKFILLMGGVFYLFFSFALWRQVELMTQTIQVKNRLLFRIVSLLHLVTAVVVFLLGFFLI